MNHKTASVSLREKIAGSTADLVALRAEIMHTAQVEAVVIVVTCNRTEIYVQTKSILMVANWFAAKLGLSAKELERYTYTHYDIDAIRHLMYVACGLDSMVLGEVEILGQLKAAYKLSKECGAINTILSRLFESTFAVAKEVRTQTPISVNPVSVAYLAVTLAKRIFANIADQEVLVIGAGATAQLLLRHFLGAGVSRFIIANRSRANAKGLLQVLEGCHVELVELAEIPKALPRADIIMATTNSQLPLVGKGMVENALKARKYRSMFMIDLSVPRNIEPEVQQIADVYLYGIDDLQTIAAEHRETRYTAIPQAEVLIEKHVTRFLTWLDGQQAIATIAAFRRKCEYKRDRTLNEALAQLENGKDPKEVLVKFAHVLLNRLIHEPTVQIRRAGIAKNNEILNVMREFFET